MNIGICGIGFVGTATAKVLENHHLLYLYDKYKHPYTGGLESIAKYAEVVFICVPTPMQFSGAIDYNNIYSSVKDLEDAVRTEEQKSGKSRDIVVVIRSTAVSGTTNTLAEAFPRFKFAFNPEFLREKHSIEDMQNTDRIVIGANENAIHTKISLVYLPVFPNAKYILVDTATAEMIKYAANVMLAGQVALANEIYQICQAIGIDYEKVKNTILLDDRIARNIDVPGPDSQMGYGGKCLPKDLNALIYLAREHNYRPYLLEEVWRLNGRVREVEDWFDIKGATSNNNFK
jgi:UDPglucose 6-dehydrogenase